MTSMSCDVVVVGGGISGMYMAETLMRMKKEDNVCLFEKDSRFGGRVYDVRFSQAPNISISKLICCHPETRHAYFFSVFGGRVVFRTRRIFPFQLNLREKLKLHKQLTVTRVTQHL